MKRRTISWSDQVDQDLEREARRRETSVSDLVRQAVVAHFDLKRDKPRNLPFAGIVRSGAPVVSTS